MRFSLILLFFVTSCSSFPPKGDNSKIFLDKNNVTVKCPDAKVGYLYELNGVEYLVVNDDLLRGIYEKGPSHIEDICCEELDIWFQNYAEPYKEWVKENSTENICLSKVENLDNFFSGGYGLHEKKISNWDVSNVKSMELMFNKYNPNQSGDEFDIDLSYWDVSNVINMSGMFAWTDNNFNISTWDVSSVKTMDYMFYLSEFNEDISSWDVGNVENMEEMFANTESFEKGGKFNQDISGWNVSKVTNMREMFKNSEFNQDISRWDVSNVTNMRGMFEQSSFNQNLSNWDVSNVTNMRLMFSDTNLSGDIDLSKWDVEKVSDCSQFFSLKRDPKRSVFSKRPILPNFNCHLR